MKLQLGYRGIVLGFAIFVLPNLAIVTNASAAVSTPVACEALLDQPLHGSSAHLAQLAEQKRGSFAAKQSKFTNPVEERAKAETWAGEKGPEFFQAFLPDGATFINHQLKNSEGEGIVKVMQQNGEFLVLRVEMPWRGKMIATNVTISAFALQKNYERFLKGEQRWLIGPDVAAAMDWGHGGGTNSTGGHTVDTLMNSLAKDNIASIAMDQPQHGEGYRGWFENLDDYFRFRVAFLDRFVHPNVKMFMIGHSMGGEIADEAFRRWDRQDIGLYRRYRGFVPLAFVPDARPGGTFEEKAAAEQAIAQLQQLPEYQTRINPGDRDLTAKLMEDGKTAWLPSLQCSFFCRENDWSLVPSPARVPDHKVNALYVASEYDSLTVGYEKLIRKHVAYMPNTTLVTLGVRVTRTGEVSPIGHMMFDHLAPAPESPLANQLIREWVTAHSKDSAISAHSDAELAEMFKTQLIVPHVSELYFLTPANNLPSSLILAAYYHSEDFKKFLDEKIKKDVDPTAAPVDEDGDAISYDSRVDAARRKFFLQFGKFGEKKREIFEVTELIRDFISQTLAADKVSLSPQPPTNSSEMKALKFYGNTFLYREFLETYATHQLVPTAKFIQLNQLAAEFQKYDRQLEVIRKDKRRTDSQKEADIAAIAVPGVNGQAMSQQERQQINQLATAVRDRSYVPDNELADFARENVARREVVNTEIKRKIDATKEVKAKIDDLSRVIRRWENKFEQRVSDSRSEEFNRAHTQKRALKMLLDSKYQQLEEMVHQHLSQGFENGQSFPQIFDQIDASLLTAFEEYSAASDEYQAARSAFDKSKIDAVIAGHLDADLQRLARNLLEKMQQLDAAKKEMESVGFDLRQLRAEKDQLSQEYATKILPDYLTYQSEKVIDLLNDPSRFEQVKPFIELSLQAFNSEVWGHRPPPAKMSLY